MTWYEINLTKEQIDSGLGWKITQEFLDAFVEHDTPKGMALFVKESNPSRTYYLSEEAVPFVIHFIEMYQAAACDKPFLEELEFVAGHSDH